jgi:hypothetical protein
MAAILPQVVEREFETPCTTVFDPDLNRRR